MPLLSFYAHGEEIRKKSKFAAKIQAERDAEEEEMNEKKKGNQGQTEHRERSSRDSDETVVEEGGGNHRRNAQAEKGGTVPFKQRDTPSKRMAYL